MKLSNQKLSVEGYQEQASWIGKLFSPLNQFISQVYTGFQNNLTVTDNLHQEIKTITFINDSVGFPIISKLKFDSMPQVVLLCSCYSSTGLLPSVQPLMDWSYKDGNIHIASISGLTSNLKYTIKLLIIYS